MKKKAFDKSLFKLFINPNEVKEWISTHFSQEQLDEFDMNKHMDDPISNYKGSGYQMMNEIIRKGWAEANNTLFDVKGLQNQLLRTSIPENICVTRFITPMEFFSIFKSTCFGKTMTYNGFLSTTLLKDYYAMEYIKEGRIAISLYIPEGLPGTYLPEVNPNNPEYEILLPYGMKLKRLSLKEYYVVA